jgi:hypothetical protein
LIQRSVWVAVQIVKLDDTCEAALQQLDVQLGRNRSHVVGIQTTQEPIHHLAPGPKAVGKWATPLGQSRHCALKRMRVEVDHTRQHRTVEHHR